MTPSPDLHPALGAAALALTVALAALAVRRRRQRRVRAMLTGLVVVVLAAVATAAPPDAAQLDGLMRHAARAADAQAASARDLIATAEQRRTAQVEAARAIADASPGALPGGFAALADTDFGGGERRLVPPNPTSPGVVYVAVSFSMPAADLRRLARDAQAAGALVVIQGLVRGSFKETARAARQVFDESSLGGVAIDPNIFRAFHIAAAPTFIAAAGPVEPCARGLDCIPAAPPHERVAGNVTLAEALRLMSRGNIAGDVAASARARLGP